jgi:hypothetical protein
MEDSNMTNAVRCFVLVLILPLLAECQAKTDSASQGKVTSHNSAGATEWAGTVTTHMVKSPSSLGDGMRFTSVMVLDAPDGQFAVLNPPGVVLAGLALSANGVVWELGKQYRIQGTLVTDPAELEAARSLGLSQIIMASRIELVDSPRDTSLHSRR